MSEADPAPEGPVAAEAPERTLLDEPVVAEALAFVSRQVDERPYLTLAAAAGAGVVLGGGVPNWALGLAWRNGGSKLLTGALAPVVAAVVKRALGNDEGDTPETSMETPTSPETLQTPGSES